MDLKALFEAEFGAPKVTEVRTIEEIVRLIIDNNTFNVRIGKKEGYMAKNEKTSRKIASIASKILRNKRSSKASKSVAGSALTQSPDKKK